MAEKGITKQQLIAELSRSPHAHGTTPRVKGQKPEPKPKINPTDRYKEYMPISMVGAAQEPEFYSRLLSWNLAKGQVKDSRVALPVIALSARDIVNDTELYENALAHMAALDPRLFVRALEFAKDNQVLTRTVRRLVTRYVRDREADREIWDRTMLSHRRSMHRLYKRFHIAPADAHFPARNHEWEVLNGYYEMGSSFTAVAQLRDMPLTMVTKAIAAFKISPLVVMPALGKRLKDPNVMVEFIRSMSPTELISNIKLLEKLGVKNEAVTRAALDEALTKAKESKKATLKTTQAAQQMADVDEQIAAKLRAVQEKQIEIISTIDGDWLVLVDKSGSMTQSIEIGKQIAALLVKAVQRKVYLIFFDYGPTTYDVTGKSYDQVLEMTKRITSGGGTNLGVAVNYALQNQIRADGLVVVSDGADHGHMFVSTFQRYADFLGKVPPVYFYRVKGEPDSLTADCAGKVELTTHDIHGTADYYSLPNMIATMRVNSYSLLDEIMRTPLLKLDEVLPRTTGVSVISAAPIHA